jgi:hypothetical protein
MNTDKRELAFAANAEELRWFFSDSSGEMGMRSNYPSMILRIHYGRSLRDGSPVSEIDEHALDAAYRARRIQRTLEAAGSLVSAMLWFTYGWEAPAALRKAYQELAGLVFNSPVSYVAFRRSGTSRTFGDWLARLPKRGRDDKEAQKILDRINVSAHNQLLQAQQCYREAKRLVAFDA